MSDFKRLSDDELNSLVSKGNDFAFRELFTRYWEKLYVAAYKVLGDEDASEDIVQDIFLNLWERSSEVEIKNIRAYFYQAVRYQVTNHIKKIRFVDKRAEIVGNHLMGNNVDDYMASNETQTLIDRTITSLPSRCREVFCLSRFENLSNKEIASKLGISVLTVETHMKRSLKCLRKSLDLACVISVVGYFLV